jgi:hypothetical protein
MKFFSMLFFDDRKNMMDTKVNIVRKIWFCFSLLAQSLPLRNMLMTTLLLLGVSLIGACHDDIPDDATTSLKITPTAPPAEMSLFDGKTLGNWKITDFGGQGKVYVKDGSIYLEQGNDMTGITWAGPLVRMNYEITLEAMRISGSDFFCGLTFPVNDNCCSLILGGWGGTLCGLSNIDYYDAANNETTRFVSFENGKWYHVRLRVIPNHIQAWLQEEGEEPLVDIDITGRKIDTRAEVDLSQPLGIATWQTAGAVRNIKLKKLTD